jgi:hypothetical protein
MKFSTHSILNPKRLFVPINEFEFNTFAVRIRRPAPRPTKADQSLFAPRRRPTDFWVLSPIAAEL